MPPEPDPRSRQSRRSLLAGAAVATAAVLATKSLGSHTAEGADGDPIVIGQAKVGSKLTALYGFFNGQTFAVWNNDGGGNANAITAVVNTQLPIGLGDSIAVFGKNGRNNGNGVWGEATAQFGVGVRGLATGFNTTGVVARATGGSSAALVAEANSGPGIIASGSNIGIQAGPKLNGGTGIQGAANSGIGLQGIGQGPGGVGVDALGGAVAVNAAGGGLPSLPTTSGIGVQTNAPLAGLFATVPPGQQDGVGAWGNSNLNTAPGNVANLRTGILGTGSKIGAAGVAGSSDLTVLQDRTDPAGVVGVSSIGAGSGVLGLGTAIGVEGESAAGVGVAARTGTGVALRVQGKNEFSQAGTGTIPAGKRNVTINGLTVGPNSGVVATLNTAPPEGVYLQFARAVPNNRIVVILNEKTPKPIKFSYFVIDKAP